MTRAALVLLLTLLAASAAFADGLRQDFAAALAQWQQAVLTRDSTARARALQALIALRDARAHPELLREYARSMDEWRRARDSAFEKRFALEHRERVIADLELRVARDSTLERHLAQSRERSIEQRAELSALEERRDDEAAWMADLGAGLVELHGAVGASAAKALEKELWKQAEEEKDFESRLGSIEVLGLVGGEGTAVALQKLLADFGSQRRRLARDLPKAEVDVSKFEARMQREQEQLDGRTLRGTEAEYDRIRKEAARLRRELTRSGVLCDAVVGAARSALSREQGKARERSLGSLLRAFRGAEDEVRLRTLEILSGGPTEEVVDSLRALLSSEKEPAAVARLLGELAALGDPQLFADVRDTYLDAREWVVQSAGVAALATLRSAEAVPLLIERLDAAQGRLRTDLRHALVSLTGQDFRTNAELWRRWWEQQAEGFVVPAGPTPVDAGQDVQDQVGVTFFGISTESQRVLFLLDLSSSMAFSMVPRDNPEDDPSRPFDRPREGEPSRMESAKRDLLRALGGLRDGAVFNIVLYASDVWSWQDECVEMDGRARAELLRYIEGLEPVGGTNIYGALQAAFELVEVEGGDQWPDPLVDTIYLLSDGRASVGVTTDSDEILAYVRDMNRSAGITIHTIGLSGAHNAYLMRSLAEQNGGIYASR